MPNSTTLNYPYSVGGKLAGNNLRGYTIFLVNKDLEWVQEPMSSPKSS